MAAEAGRAPGRPESEPRRSICLIETAAAVRNPTGATPAELLLVPETRSFLIVGNGACPRIVDSYEWDSETGARHYQIEPIRRGRSLHLLVCGSGVDLEINGAPAPPLALVDERDVLTVDEGRVNLHVSTYVRPYAGPAPEDVVGLRCGFCQTPVGAGTRIYRCAFCDSVFHHDANDTDAPEGVPVLACAASMRTCPNCLNPVLSEPGLTSIPEEVAGGKNR